MDAVREHTEARFRPSTYARHVVIVAGVGVNLDVFTSVRDTVGVHLDADGELVSVNEHDMVSHRVQVATVA